ncbi:MAG TPA: paraquat-inducible protein A [Arenicellales bacterium]|jgi:uncharacterized paraquat-inducible protein A|nr:hypothetical protein [Acidiferrobacteraceae bacterium]MDP7218248.1 paraquat-inducible protein A [Arenicellales bacterium]HJP09536.1 paraquat-inducible protein A [Arenicellales bacterium]|tara:strand:- start:983 stop:1441 length:459 start_codon:yes stop_codon:yes gene_type:complete
MKDLKLTWIVLSIIEAITLVLGATLPLAHVSEFWVFKNEFSIFSLTAMLFSSGEFLLGIVVGLFGFVVPMAKILMRHFVSTILSKFALHKFSMVDIFLLSFLVYSSKISSVFDLELLVGFYFLLTSIVVGYFQIIFSRREERLENQNEKTNL